MKKPVKTASGFKLLLQDFSIHELDWVVESDFFTGRGFLLFRV